MFNWRKFSQQDISGSPQQVLDSAEDLGNSLEEQINDQSVDGYAEDQDQLPQRLLDPEQERIISNLAAQNALAEMNTVIDQIGGDEVRGRLQAIPAYARISEQANSFNMDSFNLGADESSMLQQAAMASDEYAGLINQFKTEVSRLSNLQDELTNQQLIQQQQGILAFNLKNKKAQVAVELEDVSGLSQLVMQYLEPLMVYDGTKGENDRRSEEAKHAILNMVSPAAVEEVNSPLEEIQQLEPVQIDEAKRILSYIYSNWIANASTMEPVMSEKNPKGIIKHDLTAHVLNNQGKVVKTAADQFGQQYLLYGPTEKRICPKLRGKGGGVTGSGDVVSEYICRHHCLDGIVIDDNKTICGEALWRANVMDKQSREYVDEDGRPTGGYIEKRFEVNHNTPEENRMRLKPGEVRKPRPPEWGSTESRMQAMRNKEAQDRDYRPDSNDGEPFRWCTDPDQNNVEVPQAERDRREEAMGHQTVQYTNKDQQENNKRSFNLKNHKEASVETDKEAKGRCWEGYEPTPGKEPYEDDSCQPKKDKKKSFNLKDTKEACGAAIPNPQDGKTPDIVDETHRKPMEAESRECPQCKGESNEMGSLGSLVHFACRNCGWEFHEEKDDKVRQLLEGTEKDMQMSGPSFAEGEEEIKTAGFNLSRTKKKS